jgi:hypothetical protein
MVGAGVIASTVFYFVPAIVHRFAPDAPFFYMANNPAILATCGIVAGWAVVGACLVLQKKQPDQLGAAADQLVPAEAVRSDNDR